MSRLAAADKAWCAIYAVVALIGLIGTQLALIRHISTYDGNAATGFLTDSVANPASTFGVVDLLAVALVALVFMIAEGRRLRMRFLWVYVALTFLVAISVALPAFLIARQIRMAEQRET